MSRNRVYVARKDCGCIVAAFPVNMDKAIKGKILEQLSKAGLDIEQTSELDVQLNFHLICDHNRPPLLDYVAEQAILPAQEEEVGEVVEEEDEEDDGVESADVDAMSEDISDEVEEAIEHELSADEF